ncbi:MAG: radical SAM protein [Candidatus Omnitrophica bacterium]|nr:radical SAM protein [Candidatus Omnitrophota bacterium]
MGIDSQFDESYKICEYPVDPSWEKIMNRQFPRYEEYRRNWKMASEGHIFPFPLCVEVESSYYCNLRCPMCAREVIGTFDEKGFLEPEIYTKLLKEASQHQMSAIMMDHEGEPLTNPRIADMVKEAQDAGLFDIWLHTNANLLTEELSEALIKNGITKMNFSIDAATEQTYDKIRIGGNYPLVVKNVMKFLELKKKMKKDYIRTRVSFVLQKDNGHEREAFINLWKDKVNLISIQSMVDFKHFVNSQEELSADDLKKFICFRAFQLLIVRYNGDVIPCGMTFRHYKKEEYDLGNLKNTTIEECWNSKISKHIRECHLQKQHDKIPFCRDCNLGYKNSAK